MDQQPHDHHDDGQPSGQPSVRDQVRAVRLPDAAKATPGQSDPGKSDPRQLPVDQARTPGGPGATIPSPPTDLWEATTSDDLTTGGRLSATGVFEIDLTPQPSEAEGQIHRFGFTKTWAGDLVATGVGVMLAGGDPATGNAGYVAIETINGTLLGREGGFLLQQFGDLAEGAETLHYQVVNGSGTGDLVGLAGVMDLDIDEYGTHRYLLEFNLPEQG